MTKEIEGLIFDIDKLFEDAEEAVSFNQITQEIKEDYEENLHEYRAEDLQRQAKVAEIMHKIPGYEMFN